MSPTSKRNARPRAAAAKAAASPRPRSGKDPAPAPSLAAILRALGDDTRLEILEQLARTGDPLCMCDLECCFDLSQPTISHHVKVLRDAGLVKCERRGTWVHCAIGDEALGRVATFLERLSSTSGKRKERRS